MDGNGTRYTSSGLGKRVRQNHYGYWRRFQDWTYMLDYRARYDPDTTRLGRWLARSLARVVGYRKNG